MCSAAFVVVFLFMSLSTLLLPDSSPKKTLEHPERFMSLTSSREMGSVRDRQDHFIRISSLIKLLQKALT